MFEKSLIEWCSPTLASLKTANLFNYKFSSRDELFAQIKYWNYMLASKGIVLEVMRCHEHAALIYVYRYSHLRRDFQKNGVADFLKGCGYDSTNVNYAVGLLKSKLAVNESFPHEIGLFLGYPLDDVLGFIRNGGKNFKCNGCWKVYCNECEAVKAFARFNKCSNVYAQLWNNGRSVMKLTVSA